MGRSSYKVHDAYPSIEASAKNKPTTSAMSSALEMFVPSVANSRTVFLYSDVNDQTISGTVQQLLALSHESKDPIYLVISTPGGTVLDMLSLYDLIKFIPCPVHTVGLGKVMSAGILLLSAGVKGKRLIGANSRLMIHGISSGAIGNVFEMETMMNETRTLVNLTSDALVKETKLTKKQLADITDLKTDHYFDAKTAIEYGIADKIIGD